MFSHMTFKALRDLASTDLCYLIFSVVTLTHTVAQQQQIGYCPLCTPVFPIPASALPLLTFLGLGHSPSTSSWSTRPFLQCQAQMLLNLQNSLNRPSHGETFLFYKHVVCFMYFSPCVNTFPLSTFILFSSGHRPLAPRSPRAASWPGLHCRAQESTRKRC